MMNKVPRFRLLLTLLIAAQACYYMILSIDLTLTGLVGMSLAPTPALTTLPLSLIVVVGTACAFLAGHAAARFGYRPVMVAGALTAILGGVLSALAVAAHSFTLFCIGTALTGGYRAVGGFLRFIASDYAPPAQRERSLALVMYGGVIAAALGPFAAVAASRVADVQYLGSCLLVAALGVVALILATAMPAAAAGAGALKLPAVRIRERIGHPQFLQAVLVLAGSGLVLTLVMAAGPLANSHAGHPAELGASMIQWHLVGMFAPSVASAYFLKSHGTARTTVLGAVLMAGGCALGAVSDSGWALVLTLALVGVGWNVLFVAGSAMLLRSHTQGRGAKLQGFTDGITAALSATGSFAAAGALNAVGWDGVSLIALATTVAFLAAMGLIAVRTRGPRMPAAAAQPATLVPDSADSQVSL